MSLHAKTQNNNSKKKLLTIHEHLIMYIWMNKWMDSLHQNCSWEITALPPFNAVKFHFRALILVLSVFVYLSLITETCQCLS